MNSLVLWILRTLLALCLQIRYPAVRFCEERPVRRDPSYEIYETYRYAYRQYGYLFALSEDPKAAGDGSFSDTEVLPDGADGRTQENSTAAVAGEASVFRAGATGSLAGADSKNATNGEAAVDEGSSAASAQVEAAERSRIQDYDYLMKHYFSVHASTTAERSLMTADTLLKTDLKLEKHPDEPQILIYHTHASETYADYGPEHPDATVAGAGAYLAQLLSERGWNVIHDTTAYDQKEGKLERSRAYTYALEGIQGILQEHPGIEVILDVHRDGVADSVRLVQKVSGKTAARIMFFQGMSRTPEGEIAYLPNPYLKENLAFCFQMQLALNRYPGFTRKIYLKGLRYNLHLRGRSSLIEAGAQTNTIEEARNAMELLAEAIDTVLQGT